MNFYAFMTLLVLGLFFLYFKVEWLGFTCLLIGVVVLLYNPVKKQYNKASEELKKAEGSFPDAKFDAYTKGVSKQFAENMIKTSTTETNYKGFLHKTSGVAKNFFTDLKELLGMK